MLEIIIGAEKILNNATNEIKTLNGTKLQLEHSLISISKWEFLFERPYFETEKTPEEFKEYIKCMTINSNIDKKIYDKINFEELEKIKRYCDKKGTATKIEKQEKSKNNQFVTNELIYSWMVQFNIPPEYAKWHINRLMTLINVCQENSKEQRKYTPDEIKNKHMSLNKLRRAERAARAKKH